MTILETAPIMEYAHAHLWMIFVGLGIIILGFTFAKLANESGGYLSVIILTFIATLGLIFMIIGMAFEIIEPKTNTGRIKQTIKCDDTISLNEFYNKYKILEHTQYTDVYIVEEINNDN